MRIAPAIACLLLIGCSADDPGSTSGGGTPPVLEITSPQRGTFASGDSITVSGRVSDDGPVQVSVNGLDVVPGPDGSFTTTVRVKPGIAIFETHAVDADDHDVDDVRAVMVGTQAPTDGSLAAPIGAHAGPGALTAIGNAIATAAEGINFTAVGQALNPIYNNTGCAALRIDITSVSVGNITAGLVPRSNTLATDVAIDNVEIKLNAAFKVACLGSSTTITVRSTKARVHGDLGVNLTSGRIDASLAGVTVALDGFSIDIGGIPSALENLVRDRVRQAAVDALTNAIRDRVPPLAEQNLTKLIAKPFQADLLGRATRISVTPKQVMLSGAGMFVAVDTAVEVTGGEGGTFISTPAPLLASSMQVPGIGLALADDLANQLFAGLWASGAFDVQLPIESVGPLKSLLDPNTKTVDVKLSLPPMIGADTDARLTVGDLIVTARDAARAELQTIAVSLRTTLAVEPGADAKLALVLGKPEVHAQVIQQAATVSFKLSSTQIEGIVEGVWGVVGGAASDALGKLPMPALGIPLRSPTIEGREGYLVATIQP